MVYSTYYIKTIYFKMKTLTILILVWQNNVLDNYNIKLNHQKHFFLLWDQNMKNGMAREKKLC